MTNRWKAKGKKDESDDTMGCREYTMLHNV